MTIRSGRGPRDDAPQAQPMDPDAHDDDGREGRRVGRDVRRGNGNGYGNGYGERRGGGVGGFLRFLVFALVLAFIVLATLLTVLRPVVASAVVDWAYQNPGALRIPFVTDLVRENLAGALTSPASNDATEVEFTVNTGDTPQLLAPRLEAEGLITNSRAFLFEATLRELAPQLKAGDFHIARNLTPDGVVTALIENEIVIVVTPVNFREGLRLEQITAKLQTLGPPVTVDPQAFYDLVKDPPADLIADYAWLQDAGLPDGASLEGFLAPATYDVFPETTAEDLVRMMLDEFFEQVGAERLVVPESRGLTFYEVLTLASIVEREAVLDEERALIAGVYQNRLTRGGSWLLLHADPTVFYGVDTVRLEEAGFESWLGYTFWTVPEQPLGQVVLPEELAGYNTYTSRGLPPGPICTPSVASIDGALNPDTQEGYLFFLAIPDGGGAHVFARTQEEHDANRREYGYL
jgi:UPF0755 protein